MKIPKSPEKFEFGGMFKLQQYYSNINQQLASFKVYEAAKNSNNDGSSGANNNKNRSVSLNNNKNVCEADASLANGNNKANLSNDKTILNTKNRFDNKKNQRVSRNGIESASEESRYSDETDSSFCNTSSDCSKQNHRNNSLALHLPKVNNAEDISKIGYKNVQLKSKSKSTQKYDDSKDFKRLKNATKPRNRLSMCISQTRYKVVGKVAKSIGWRLVKYSGHWNILWVDTDPGIETYKEMKRYQKINHFPGMLEICRKDLLARNLGRLLKMYPSEYDFYPKTWCFPADYMEAINYNREHKHKTFILKPDAGAQGRGIFLTKNIKESVKPTERLICQVYVSRPLLIDGYKFDLRVYTLITTVEPLRVFVYNEGLVRMATSKYRDPSEYNISDLYMHLTNYSVNKRNDNYSHDATAGSKRKFSSLHRNLTNEGYDIEMLWRNIDDTIIKTILSTWPTLRHNYRACFPCHDVMQACFEILGFDILVDRNLKPYILEVNQSPSFYTDELVDREVKEALIRDTLNLLNISLIDKTKIMNEDKRRIKTRLLMTRKRTKSKSTLSKDPLSSSTNISPLGQQIAWEESHLGGFRRIMPVHIDAQRYTHLIQLQNQSSIYSETAASKRREEAAKEMRIAIIEKQKRNQGILGPNKSYRKRVVNSPFKIRKQFDSLRKDWSGGCIISDFEERDRRRLLAERAEVLNQNGILKVILEAFLRLKILSDTDRIKYGHDIKCMEHEVEQQRSRTENQNVECSSGAANDDLTVKNVLRTNKIDSMTSWRDVGKPKTSSAETMKYDEKFLPLPLLTLQHCATYRDQLDSVLKVKKIKSMQYRTIGRESRDMEDMPLTLDSLALRSKDLNVIGSYEARKKYMEFISNLWKSPTWSYYNIDKMTAH